MKEDTETSAFALLGEGGAFDPLEEGVRERVRRFIETILEEELQAVLGRGRYERSAEGATGHRNGHRERQVIGTFGAETVKVPRARLVDDAGQAKEWRSQALRRYQRLTRKAEALIGSVYLAGTNTRRVKRALFGLFEGAVSKDVVSRAWRKVKTDWEAWCARSLADEDIVRARHCPRTNGGQRLALDGTVVKARIDRKATAISVLAAIGVRRDGQKVLLAIRNMGGESKAAWRAFLDDLDARDLKAPEFILIDGAPGLEAALAELWPDASIQRCTVHKHRNLLGHAPKSLHDELTEDYRDMVYAETKAEIEQGLPPQVAAEVQGGGRQPRGSRRPAVHLHPPRPVAVEVRPNHQRHRAAARGVPPPDQDPGGAARRRDGADAVLGAPGLRPDRDAQGRRMGDPFSAARPRNP